MSEKVQSPTVPGETATQPVPQHETHSVSTAPNNGSQTDEKNEKKNGHKNFARTQLADRSRRSFLSRAGGLTAMAVAAGIVPLEPLLGGKQTQAEASDITYSESNRSSNAFNFRKQEAQVEKISPVVPARLSRPVPIWNAPSHAHPYTCASCPFNKIY